MSSIARKVLLALVLLGWSGTAYRSFADVYEPDDVAAGSNTSAGLLVHGARQVHDLEGTGDVDYILIDAVPGHSYEVRLFTAGKFTATMTRRGGDASGATNTELQAAQGLVMFSTREASGNLINYESHSSSVLIWIEPAAAAERSRYIRIDSGGAVRTAANSQYTIQMRQSTLYCPRYNTTAGQTTVLIMQTAAPWESLSNVAGCEWTASFYDQNYSVAVTGHPLAGSVKGAYVFGNALAHNGMLVIPAASVSGVAGTRGSIHVAHTCGYGNAQAKAVAFEPATGFTFDTICMPRPD